MTTNSCPYKEEATMKAEVLEFLGRLAQEEQEEEHKVPEEEQLLACESIDEMDVRLKHSLYKLLLLLWVT